MKLVETVGSVSTAGGRSTTWLVSEMWLAMSKSETGGTTAAIRSLSQEETELFLLLTTMTLLWMLTFKQAYQPVDIVTLFLVIRSMALARVPLSLSTTTALLKFTSNILMLTQLLPSTLNQKFNLIFKIELKYI